MSNTIKQAAALLRSIARLRGLAQGGEQSPNVEDMAGRLESTTAEVASLRAEISSLRASLARHKTAAGPAESVHAALGVSGRDAARAAMEHGVPCPTCGAESSPPTDTPAPCAHLDRALDGSCFGCGSDENNPNPEATP